MKTKLEKRRVSMDEDTTRLGYGCYKLQFLSHTQFIEVKYVPSVVTRGYLENCAVSV